MKSNKDKSRAANDAVKEALNGAEEFIQIAKNKPKGLKNITMGNATDILGVTAGAADELKKNVEERV